MKLMSYDLYYSILIYLYILYIFIKYYNSQPPTKPYTLQEVDKPYIYYLLLIYTMYIKIRDTNSMYTLFS